MKMKIIILILFCLIGFGINYCIGLYDTKSSLHEGTTCQGGICPPPEEYENGSDR